MAAEAQRAPSVRDQSNFAQRLRQFFAPIEPWYDWGNDATIFRLDTDERDFSDESIGEGFEFRIQWFGFHFGFVVGRTPPKIGAAEVATRKLTKARRDADRERGA